MDVIENNKATTLEDLIDYKRKIVTDGFKGLVHAIVKCSTATGRDHIGV